VPDRFLAAKKNIYTMENKTLKDMSLSVLDAADVCNTHGGSLIDFATTSIKKLTPAAFTFWVIENWDEVKKGFSDGWNVK
jgi:hypothetical protein